MYAYPVHSSVPAPRTAARASWKSAVSGCLARGLKAHPIVTGTAVLALSGAVLVGGVTLAVLFWFHVCVYTAVGSSGRFSPAPRCHRLACPSASIQSLGAAPASEPLPRGEPYPYIKSERLFSTA